MKPAYRVSLQIGILCLVLMLGIPSVAAFRAEHDETVIAIYLKENAPDIPLSYKGDVIVAAESVFSEVEGTTPVQVIRPVISLGRVRFDPASSSENWRWEGPGLYLIQFRGPVSRQIKDALTNMGMMVLDYVPHLAYLVWMDEDATPYLHGWGYVRAVVKYRPEMKISPGMDKFTGGRLILALGVRGRMRDPPGEIVSSVGGRIIHSYPLGGYTYFRFLGDVERAKTLALREDITWIETHEFERTDDEKATQIVAGNIPVVPGYQQWLKNKGVDGSGIIIGHVDTGAYAQHKDIAGRLIDVNTNGQDSGSHGTHTAGICCGNASSNKTDADGFQYGQGMAPNAKLITIELQSMSHSEYMQNIARRNGTITTFSWNVGSGTDYGAVEREYDIYVVDADSTISGEQPVSITFSAGNTGPGPGTITKPHCAKNVIAVGNSLSLRSSPPNIDQLASSSSRGPCEDGRIKPEVTAPGSNIMSAKAGTIDDHTSMTGTSMACPHVAGASALIQQWYKKKFGELPLPSLVKAMHINGATDMAGVSEPIPNMNEGWGRDNISNVIENGLKMYYHNEKSKLDTGKEITFKAGVADPGKPFKVTLVWSDAPGASGANPALVNDLDLVVEGSEGTYYGNVFSNGWSQTGGTPDALNPVENVFIKNPTQIYTIRIIGKNVPQGPQRFSLVVSNTLLSGASITLSTPKGGEVFHGGQSVSVTWTSNGSIMPNSVNLSFSKDNGTTWTDIAGGLPANFSYPWTVPRENTSVAVLKVEAVDQMGTKIFSRSGSFMIDSGPPASMASPLPGYTLNSTFDIGFTANDTLSGVENVQLFYRKGSTGVYTPGPVSNSSPIRFTAPSEGRFEFYTIAKDKAGNNESSKGSPEAWTEVDITAPSVVKTAPVNNSKGLNTNLSVRITFSESMNTTGVKVEVTPQKTPENPQWALNDTELSFSLTSLLLNTEYEIKISGKDLAGWVMPSYILKFTTIERIIVPATIDGVVKDGTTHQPLEGAEIRGYKAGTTEVVNMTTTDPQGVYTLTLPPGNYDINVSMPGYEPSQITVSLKEGESRTCDFEIYRPGGVPGTVTGYVRDEKGTPIVDASVSAGGNNTSRTDMHGAYTLSLLPGEYTLVASANGFSAQSVKITIISRQTLFQNFTLKPEPKPQKDILSEMMPWLILIIIVAAVTAAIVAFIILMKRKKALTTVCPFCKTVSPKGTQSCPNCGLLLDMPQATTPSTPSAGYQQPPPPPYDAYQYQPPQDTSQSEYPPDQGYPPG